MIEGVAEIRVFIGFLFFSVRFYTCAAAGKETLNLVHPSG